MVAVLLLPIRPFRPQGRTGIFRARMTAVAAYLQQLDQAWSHKWESLRGVLDGVTEEEAAWQAPCYASEPPEEGWPLPGTIRWQVAHLAHCKRYYAACVRARGAPGRPPDPVRAPTASFAEDLRALEAAHADQRAAIAECGDTDLDTKVNGAAPLSEFLASTIRHDTWHGGQIAVARRLWRRRG